MAYIVDLFVDQGTPYSNRVYLEDDTGGPVDLTGFTAKGQAAKSYTSLTKFELEIDLFSDLAESYITIGLTKAVGETMAAGRYVYDVELYSPTGVPSRTVQGVIHLSPQVTREA